MKKVAKLHFYGGVPLVANYGYSLYYTGKQVRPKSHGYKRGEKDRVQVNGYTVSNQLKIFETKYFDLKFNTLHLEIKVLVSNKIV